MSIRSLFPDTRPSLLLDFANAKQLDPRITFTRNSTATYVGRDGLIKTADIGFPRFDHDPVTGESLGLLVEESRTNQYTYSDGGPIVAITGTTLTPNTTDTLDPRGGYNASKISRTSGYAYQNINSSVGNNVIKTMSFWIKYNGSGTFANVGTDGAGGRFYVYVYWEEDSINVVYNPGNTNSTGYGIVVKDYPNGWYRVSATFSCSGTPGYQEWQFSGSGTDNYFIYGFQLETGSFPTSYIPTSGSTVTRAQDFASITGTNFSDWYNPYEGSLYSSFMLNGLDPSYNNTSVMINNNTENEYIAVFGYNPAYAWVQSSGGTSFGPALGGSTTTDVNYRVSMAYRLNDFAATINGSSAAIDTSGVIPTVDRMFIGRRYSTDKPLNGTIKKLAYYPKRLTNDQLQTLTK